MITSTITSILVAWSLAVSVDAYTSEGSLPISSRATRIYGNEFSRDSSADYGVGNYEDGLFELDTGDSTVNPSSRDVLFSKRDTSFEDPDMINLVRRKKKKEKTPAQRQQEADKKAKAEADKRQKKEAAAKRKEQAKAEKKRKHDEKQKAKQAKKDAAANKRAKDNHALELKANKKSAEKRIKEVNKTGDRLAKDTKKQLHKNEKNKKKEKSRLEKAEKNLEAAKRPGRGKKHDKNLRKAEKEVQKAKGNLAKTEKNNKQSIEKINSKADKSIYKSKQAMFNDWKKNNKAQWKVTQDGIAEAIKHPSKAKQIGMKILKAFEWIGTAALSIIPGLGAAMAAGVTAAKTVAQVAIKEGVKAGIKQGVKKGIKKGVKKGVKDGIKKGTDGKQQPDPNEPTTFSMNSAEDDKKAGVETNAMKLEVQNQRNGYVNEMDDAINKAKAKGARVRRALEDMGVWDEALGLQMWKRCMTLDVDASDNGVYPTVMRRVVEVSVRNEIKRRWDEEVLF